MAENVFPQQDLARTPFKAAKVNLFLGERDALFGHLSQPSSTQIDAATADLHNEAGRQRIVASAQADNYVVYPANGLPASVHDRPAKQHRQMHDLRVRR
jgi:hypothetical protein